MVKYVRFNLSRNRIYYYYKDINEYRTKEMKDQIKYNKKFFKKNKLHKLNFYNY